MTAVDGNNSSSTEIETPSGGSPKLVLQNQLSESPMEDNHRRNSPQPDSPGSSSSVEIEEVMIADDTDVDLDIMVNGMDEDTIVNDVLDKFPYADQRDGGYQSAANLYLNHVEGHGKLGDPYFAPTQLTSFRQH